MEYLDIVIVLSIIFVLVLLISKRSLRDISTKWVRKYSFSLIALSLYVLLYLGVKTFLDKKVFILLYHEDGIFEYLTTVFFLAASFQFLKVYFKGKSTMALIPKAFLGALAMFSFFVGMEEISWGQRILNIETPENIEKINFQGETTIHNLISADHYTIIYFIISLCFLAFFSFSSSKFKSVMGIDTVYLPSEKFLLVALLLPLIAYNNREHFEVILSFMFFVYSYNFFQKTKRDLSPV